MVEMVRSIPPIHELQKKDLFIDILNKYNIPHEQLTSILKDEIKVIRQSIIENRWRGHHPKTEEFIQELFTRMEKSTVQRFSYSIKKVINATGTILHTNVGRARLSVEAAAHVMETALSYTNLEYDIENGTRGSRHTHIEDIIKALTGAEAALVVNNNAAAVYFILHTFAQDKEVIISRGELIEIGGSFRVSSIMEESGAKLIEVGTTNRTHFKDYEDAISEQTAILMKVHTSNFIIKGFTSSVDTKSLYSIKENHPSLILYEDLGSGALMDLSPFGIGNEPTVSSKLKAGADIVSFSGDKLLGGPQAGIIAGKKEYIDKLKKHQLARVLRVDKMTIAALEATLMHYLKGEALSKIPALSSITMDSSMMKQRTEAFKKRLSNETQDFTITIREDTSQIGGGSLPEITLETYVLSIKHKYMKAEDLAKQLRKGQACILTRIHQDEVIFDFRTIQKEEEDIVLEQLMRIPGQC
ncbi:L-seryl-tRNA(Sec) selenium transferase [Bacillus sp. FJAT-49736]|uniref:L-seryl-tRNA(Sec) selenium transferase n=1 Tax=Bacillus sp. FJAT-49736 TaxID=2833582 RepID=UPI001BCA08F6|nr:L-seryl-tRNA(Sec) selenium transferase [Bacillus sp. FJAT-49736]MBS4172996.1 L-seryl-tRNA(Sec) selenium transferase [Bacillus sp. FJAT-49736]